MTALHAIEPPGCGCTDCCTGWSVPLDNASAAQIADMLADRILDRTGAEITVTTTVVATWEHLSWRLS